MRLTLKTGRRVSSFAARAADAQRLLGIKKDPRFVELQEALQKAEDSEKSSRMSFFGTGETKASWKQHLRDGLRKLIHTVSMSSDPSMAERQLEDVYRWYVTSQPGQACKAVDSGLGFYNFGADEVLRHPAPPGSAYYTKEDHENELVTSESMQRVED